MTKARMAKEMNLDPNKKWLLFAEDRMIEAEERLLNLDNPMEKRYLDEDIKSLNETMNQMEMLDENFFNDFELIYRLHPGSAVVPAINDRVRLIKEYSIYDWLKCIDALIVSKSTTAFEADMNGIPVFFHNPFDTTEEYLMPGINKYYTIHNLNEISESSIYSAGSHQKDKKIYKDYMGENDGMNASRMIEYTIQLIDSGNPNLEAFTNNYSRLYYIKKYIRGYIFRIYKKTGLLNLLKTPSIFYNNQEDIPF